MRLAGLLDPEKFAVILVGLTPEQSRQTPDNVITIPRTNSPKELAEIYTASDIFFLPSYEENYPTVSLEAQACGTPVIAYDSGGNSETMSNPHSRLVKAGDLDAVKEILEGLRP